MTPERYQQIRGLARAARDLDPDNRSDFLMEVCAGDAELRREVESFIFHGEQAADFLEDGAIQKLARQMADESPTRSFEDSLLSSHSLPIESAPFAPDTMLDNRYSIVRLIGQGGLGTVLLAQDRKLHDAQVVVKVLKAEFCRGGHGAWFEKKFQLEIKALARIDHPGVVRALDTGALPDGRAYLVMQYVPGVTLRSLIPAQGMELRRVARLIRQIGQALAAAHEQGVIHRDLKPENIMAQNVGDEEYIKLIDFGIASVWESTTAVNADTTQVAGTTSYMAPEQLRGKPTVASDIYAFAVIAYELVTGRRPFNPDTVFEMLDLQRQGVKVRPCDLRPSLPPAAEAVILKSLSFAAAERHASSRDFAEELFHALLDENRGLDSTLKFGYSPRRSDHGAKSPRRLPARLWLPIAALLLIGVVGALFASFIWGASGNKTPPVKEAQPIANRRLSYTLVVRRNPQRYPDNSILELTRSVIFESGDHIRLRLNSSQAGYLYVINEGPVPAGGQPNYYVLFPYALANNFSAAVAANQTVQIPTPSDKPQMDWLMLAGQEGVEKIWLIWAERLVAELESVKHYADFEHMGKIQDADQVRLVAQYLRERGADQPTAQEDDARRQTTLEAKSGVLVGLVKLEHH
jgi:serine/threonine protein kinase